MFFMTTIKIYNYVYKYNNNIYYNHKFINLLIYYELNLSPNPQLPTFSLAAKIASMKSDQLLKIITTV